MKRFPKFTIAPYTYAYRDPVVLEPVPEPEPVVGYIWTDVFADHTLLGGEDWTTWGTAALTPAEVPLEWFMRNVMATETPDGALITLESPTGEIFFTDRMQPPPTSVARNWTLDLTDQAIERGISDRNWGQLHLWGELVADPNTENEGIVGTTASVGASQITLTDGASSLAFLAAVQPGSIVEVRTNATAPNYHPAESRTTIYVLAKNEGLRRLTLALPLEMTVPASNPTGDFPGETVDYSTLKLLVGSLLTSGANAGENFITVADASGFSIGDWINISTIEVPAPDGNQFMDGLGSNDFVIDESEDFGSTPIQCNEELHQIAGISGDVITLTQTLGKNKLVLYRASALKVDPIEGATIIGGNWNGAEVNTGAEPWDHQYIWGRYMVGCEVRDGNYDMDPARALNTRRMGQAIRLDTGDGNLVYNNTVGKGGGIEAGEAYGISFRLGERNSIIRANVITECRHSIEMWSTSGGCIIEDNLCSEDTSSSIDTHGAWNVGIIIRRNVVTRTSGAQLSSDSGGQTDAIRIGNPKFMWDEDIELYDNVVRDYHGVAFKVVPGSRRVTVDGLDIDNVQRGIVITANSRHPDLFAEDITIRNVTMDSVSDRLTEISHSVSGKVACKGLVLEDWLIGVTGTGTTSDTVSRNIRVLQSEDVALRNIRLENIEVIEDQFAWWFEDVVGLELTDLYQNGGERGIQIRDTTGVTGTGNIINGLTAGTPYLVRADGVTSGTLTIIHDQGGTPSHEDDTMTITLIAA